MITYYNFQTKLFTSNSGFLFNKLRNDTRKKTYQNVIAMDTNDETPDSIQQIPNDELMNFFKYCSVEKNKEELKNKLAESVEYRRPILANPPEPIHKMFGFYFVDSELVTDSIHCTSNEIFHLFIHVKFCIIN